MMGQAPKSILVINVTRIGDTLLAVPALRALATAWPDARLTVLGHPKRVAVLENLPFLAEVGPITKQRAVFRGWLPGHKYDLALVYGHDEALLKYAFRVARRVVAFRQSSQDINARLYKEVQEAVPHSEHAVDAALRLVRALGLPPAGRRLQFALSIEERAEAEALIAAKSLAGHHPLIGFQVACFPTKAYRDWPEAHFIDLCKRLLALKPGAAFVIFGGPDDREKVSRIQAALGPSAVDLAGLSLRRTAGVMALLDAYVGVDTGPTHIMGCFDIPLVALYHCKLPHRCYGARDHPYDFFVEHPRLGGLCDETTPMGELGVDAVFARLLEALDAHAALHSNDREK
ncbi:MAG: glycosyltransferase family 9 protein [Azonexus sp.]|jgi:heptosyltransferase-3